MESQKLIFQSGDLELPLILPIDSSRVVCLISRFGLCLVRLHGKYPVYHLWVVVWLSSSLWPTCRTKGDRPMLMRRRVIAVPPHSAIGSKENVGPVNWSNCCFWRGRLLTSLRNSNIERARLYRAHRMKTAPRNGRRYQSKRKV